MPASELLLPSVAASDLLLPGVATMDFTEPLRAFRAQGFARLGPIATQDALERLRRRSDELMLGEVRHEGLFFQHDSETGEYEDLPYGRGWQGPSLAYRKLEKLERDPVFLAFIENPLFERIARAVVGDDVSLYRALLMTKPAHGGTRLPWHQDGGRLWGLDRDPELQIWTALDDAPLDAGCIEIWPESHLRGLATPLGGMVRKDIALRERADEFAVPVPVRAGEALLIHNYVWHRSGMNRTDRPRRGFTICLMDGATRCLRKKKAPRAFPRVFVGGKASL